ncbi:MAG TPA: hypothetical protein PKY82_03530 [Pyrinomonadaceae bacterium]|nr:hypothetical protein [Pyrinomonadaceae bacterium]
MRNKKYILHIFVLMLALVQISFGQTAAGTVINNKAKLDYVDQRGENVEGETNEFKITVSPISIIRVTPDSPPIETIPPNGIGTASFEICNDGNNQLNSVISKVISGNPGLTVSRVYLDVDNNGSYSPGDLTITIGQTALPPINQGKCVSVLVDYQTSTITAGTQIPLTLTASTTNQNSNGSDSGNHTYILNRGALLNYKKTVNGQERVQVKIGDILNYQLALTNNGDADANNLLISDLIQAGSFVPGSLKINKIAKTDNVDTDEAEFIVNKVYARLSSLKKGETAYIEFQVTVSNLPNGTSIINVGQAQSPSIPNLPDSNPTIAVVDPKGLVFDGETGINAPIAGAAISLNDSNNSPLNLNGIPSFLTNPNNSNPFTTLSNGNYSFGLPCNSANYFLNVTAAGFVNRRIQVAVNPISTSPCVVNLRLTALDGLPLAELAGSLTGSSVNLSNMAGLFAYVPMFRSGAIAVEKSVDTPMAQTGDILNYKVDFKNTSNAGVSNVYLSDTLPRGFYVAENSVEILRNGSRTQLAYQILSGNILTAQIGSLAAHESVSVYYKVRIGADAAKGKNTNVVIATDDNKKPISTPGQASVEVYPGLDSERQTLVGRVFVDRNGDGIYNLRDGDLPLSNVQVVTSTGRAALTDSEGKYSIPTYSAGKTSVAIIRNTIPTGLLPKYHNSQDGDWSQLVHSPLNVGMIQTANFPLVEVSSKDPASPTTNTTSEIEAKGNYLAEIIRVKAVNPLDNTEAGRIVINANESDKTAVTGKSVINAGVQTRIGNSITFFVNGIEIPATLIGEKVIDNKTGMMMLVYYNLQLKTGLNMLEAVISDGNGVEIGKISKELLKGGKAVRYEIIPEKSRLDAGGRDKTSISVKAFDKNNLPAEDSEVMLSATNGSLTREKANSEPVSVDDLIKPSSSPLVVKQNEVVKIFDGVGTVQLTSGPKTATANLYLTQGFNVATTETAIAESRVDFTEPAPIPTIVGFGEFYWGEANPGILQAGKDKTFFSGRASLWGRVPLFRGVLTGAYQSNLPLNRDETFDRNLVGRFNFNNPNFDETYSIFGDSSQRYFLAPSNTKGFARWEKDLNFVQFGDFNARQRANNNSLFSGNTGMFRLTDQKATEISTGPKLAAYNRNLTGLQVHLEDNKGNLFELSGARPDTAFGRDIFNPSGLSRIRLSASDVLYGSETVTVETRDRRTPEMVVKRETLLRDQDYEIDYLSGVIFIKSNLLLFDAELNPNQLVISYEHRGDKTSTVILGRGEKTFQNGNYRIGGTFNYTAQAGTNAYTLGGLDFKAKLPNGLLEFEVARSSGTALGFGNTFSNVDSDGFAFLANYSQKFRRIRTNVNFVSSQNGFNNPFGSIVQRGSTRLLGQVEFDATSQDAIRVQGSLDRTETENFSNDRQSLGVMWKRSWNDKLSTILGYDFRHFSDDSGQFGGENRNSHLITAGVNWNPTKKLSLSLVREQNLTNENDPAYPNNTLLQAEYRINQWSKFFAVNRFGGAINPIGDSSQIVAYQSKREFTSGFETKFKQGTSLMSAYRSEDGLNGQESFAITGLQQKFNWRKNWSTDLGYQFAWKLAGESLVTKQNTYHNAFAGVTYARENGFSANARYEFRSRLGKANLFSTGIAGKLNQNWTMLGKFSFAQADQTFDQSFRKSSYGQIGGALRPKGTDRYGVLFQYQFRDYAYRTENGFQAKADLRHYFTADAFYQPNTKWNFFAKSGLRFVSQSENAKAYATWMNLLQGRVEYRFDKYFDVGGEARFIQEFKTNSNRFGGALELGYWATPTFRIAGGYNYQQRTNELFSTDKKQGFYLTITTKLDRYFDWFGAKKASGQK